MIGPVFDCLSRQIGRRISAAGTSNLREFGRRSPRPRGQSRVRGGRLGSRVEVSRATGRPRGRKSDGRCKNRTNKQTSAPLSCPARDSANYANLSFVASQTLPVRETCIQLPRRRLCSMTARRPRAQTSERIFQAAAVYFRRRWSSARAELICVGRAQNAVAGADVAQLANLQMNVRSCARAHLACRAAAPVSWSTGWAGLSQTGRN